MKKIIEVQQGSPEWHEFRAKSFGASEAAAMLGMSSYKTRSQLLKEKATGLVPEVDAATHARFDRGHEYESIARPWAEEIVGEDLYPVTLSMEIDGITLSASMDGLTMLEDAGWEHKTLNATLAESLANGIIPDEYLPQLEQQLLVSGAERILFMASSGDRSTMVSAWYESYADIRARLIAGWKQFAADLAEYQHQEAEFIPSGKAPDSLPALHIEVTGMVTASNLEQFKATALAVIGGINKDLQTDEDFADAEKTVKWLGDVESRLDAAKEHALSQTASIDQLFKALDDIKENARRTRLDLGKLVKDRKESRREEIRREGVDAYRSHIDALNARLERVRLPDIAADFAGVMKGKRSIASLQDAVSVELARVKIASNEMADRMASNLNLIDKAGFHFLFADVQQLAMKDPGDLAELINARIANHHAEEKRKEDEQRERIRREEEARAQREAEAMAEKERQRIREEEQAKARAAMDDRTHPEAASNVPESVKPRVRQQAANSRPSDEQIISTLAAAYRVDHATVVGWLKSMDFAAIAA